MIMNPTSESSNLGRRETLIRLSRIGALLLGHSGFSALAAEKSARKTENKPVAETASETQLPARPERLIKSDADLSGSLDHQLFNPSTKRKIGIRIRLPITKEKTGLILYSPGLGSGLNNGAPWCEAWRNAGFVVVTLSHPVTNDDIWDISKQSLKSNLRLHEHMTNQGYDHHQAVWARQ
jgi:hypothetical protein